jgi:hypothetical protein
MGRDGLGGRRNHSVWPWVVGSKIIGSFPDESYAKLRNIYFTTLVNSNSYDTFRAPGPRLMSRGQLTLGDTLTQFGPFGQDCAGCVGWVGCAGSVGYFDCAGRNTSRVRPYSNRGVFGVSFFHDN